MFVKIKKITIIGKGLTAPSCLTAAKSIILLLGLIVLLIGSAVAQVSSDSEELASVEKTDKFLKRSVRAKLVDGFPIIPLYPDALIISSYQKSEGPKVGYEALISVSASVPQVISFYQAALGSQGWKTLDIPEGAFSEREQSLKAEKGNLILYVIAERKNSKTEISLEVPLHSPKE